MRNQSPPRWAGPNWLRPNRAGPGWFALFSTAALGALLMAACGGSPGGSGTGAVAHLGTTTTGASNSQGNSAQSGDGSSVGAAPAPAGGGHGGATADPGASQSQLLGFSHCMQTHGVPDYPQPNAQGTFSLSGINQGSPAFRHAMNHCSHLLPNNGQPTAGQLAQMEAKALKFAQCMRSHGLADFPDPQTVNGGFGIILSRSAHSDLDPHNPRFQAAQAKCGGLMGGPAPGSGTQSSSPGGHK